MIKVILFDVGGVLMPEHYFDAIYRDLAKEVGLPFEKIKLLHRKSMKRMNHGRLSAVKVFSKFEKDPVRRRKLVDFWVNSGMRHVKLNKPLVKIVDRLRKKHTLAVLSNVNELRAAVDRRLGLYTHFDRIFLSYELKMKKPRKNVFRHVLKEMKVKPQEALLVDDREKNTLAAQALGMKAILFKDNKRALQEMKRLGVL